MRLLSALFCACLFCAWLLTTAAAAPAGADLDKTAMRVAEALGGVLRNCPASFGKIGTEAKKCVGSSGSVEQVRVKLVGALGTDLYGVWRSRDEQRSVFNWVKVASGYVYVRLQADPDGRAQTLVYLDSPPETPVATPAAPTTGSSTTAPPASVAPGSTQLGGVTLTPATPGPRITPLPGSKPGVTPAPTPAATPATAPPTSSPSPEKPGQTAGEVKPAAPGTAATSPASPTVKTLAPLPFARPLQLQDARLNGPDVEAVQNRLIQLMRPVRSGRGDGWYGPVTAAAVRAFQQANKLAATGRVDRATWDVLFSSDAKPYTPSPP